MANMDEAGARVGCPTGEYIIVPKGVRDHYTASPENRKSVTIIETVFASGRKPLPPFVICPGKKVMDNWVKQKQLVGDEYITCTPTGYTNNEKALEYLDHFIKHTGASVSSPWYMLLLDGHESHRTLEFRKKAAEHNIKLFWFPSHLTHALQPLDVGIFRPWKHWHHIAVQHAIRRLDFEYSITSFMRDLAWIRDKTMQFHTIVNAFKESGMWPVNMRKGLQKMRGYNKRTRTEEEAELESTMDELPTHGMSPLWKISTAIREFEDRDPRQFSSPSAKRFKNTMQDTDVALQKAHLDSVEHHSLQQKIRAERKRRSTSRRSIHIGGPGDSVASINAKIIARDSSVSTEQLRKARKRLQTCINKARKKIKDAGVLARRQEKERIAQLKILDEQGVFPDLEMLLPIRQPDKEPNAVELETLKETFYPAELLLIRTLGSKLQQIGDSDSEVEIFATAADLERGAVEDIPSSPPRRTFAEVMAEEESEVESVASSLDSILQNADFISF